MRRTLKSRAALAGVSLTEYARPTPVESAARPSREELRAEFAAIPVVVGLEGSGDALRRRHEQNIPTADDLYDDNLYDDNLTCLKKQQP